MSRPDLPPGFGGWQVVDATPQETSDGKTAYSVIKILSKSQKRNMMCNSCLRWDEINYQIDVFFNIYLLFLYP